jgi:hypothetical protein
MAHRCDQLLGDHPIAVPNTGLEQFVPALEIVMHQPSGDAESRGDVAERCAVEAGLCEQIESGPLKILPPYIPNFRFHSILLAPLPDEAHRWG